MLLTLEAGTDRQAGRQAQAGLEVQAGRPGDTCRQAWWHRQAGAQTRTMNITSIVSVWRPGGTGGRLPKPEP